MCNNLINIFEIDKNYVCFIGDIHGDFSSLGGLMKHTNYKDTAYICCGDIGLGFKDKKEYSQIFNKLSKTASKLNCEFIFIRGNHDSKEYFDKQLIHRKCFKCIPDYSVLKIKNHNILCIGGAISIDRRYRKETYVYNLGNMSFYKKCSLNEAKKLVKPLYWEDEICIYDEDKLSQLKLNNINIDIVCTHTCPSFSKPIGKENIKSWLDYDKELEKDLNTERETMDKIYAKLKSDGHSIEKWLYGHFHFHNSEFINNTNFIMLDMCRNGICDFYDITT